MTQPMPAKQQPLYQRKPGQETTQVRVGDVCFGRPTVIPLHLAEHQVDAVGNGQCVANGVDQTRGGKAAEHGCRIKERGHDRKRIRTGN